MLTASVFWLSGTGSMASAHRSAVCSGFKGARTLETIARNVGHLVAVKNGDFSAVHRATVEYASLAVGLAASCTRSVTMRYPDWSRLPSDACGKDKRTHA